MRRTGSNRGAQAGRRRAAGTAPTHRPERAGTYPPTTARSPRISHASTTRHTHPPPHPHPHTDLTGRGGWRAPGRPPAGERASAAQPRGPPPPVGAAAPAPSGPPTGEGTRGRGEVSTWERRIQVRRHVLGRGSKHPGQERGQECCMKDKKIGSAALSPQKWHGVAYLLARPQQAQRALPPRPAAGHEAGGVHVLWHERPQQQHARAAAPRRDVVPRQRHVWLRRHAQPPVVAPKRVAVLKDEGAVGGDHHQVVALERHRRRGSRGVAPLAPPSQLWEGSEAKDKRAVAGGSHRVASPAARRQQGGQARDPRCLATGPRPRCPPIPSTGSVSQVHSHLKHATQLRIGAVGAHNARPLAKPRGHGGGVADGAAQRAAAI